MTSTFPEDASDELEWTATWGDQLRVGDLIRVTKLGGHMRVTQLRRWATAPVPGVYSSVAVADEHSWYWGAVVTDPLGREFHLFIKPYEAVFIATSVPANGDLSSLETEA